MPRRHGARCHLLLDGLGPRPDFFIIAERHRRRLTRTVTAHASVVQNRRNLFRKRRRFAAVGVRRKDAGGGNCEGTDR